MCSSLKSEGFNEIWDFVLNFVNKQKKNKKFYENRESQKTKWMWNSVSNNVNEIISNEIVRNKFILKIKDKVKNKNINIFQASELIIDYFIKNKF